MILRVPTDLPGTTSKHYVRVLIVILFPISTATCTKCKHQSRVRTVLPYEALRPAFIRSLTRKQTKQVRVNRTEKGPRLIVLYQIFTIEQRRKPTTCVVVQTNAGRRAPSNLYNKKKRKLFECVGVVLCCVCVFSIMPAG